LEVTGREVVTGGQVAGSDRLGRLRWDGGLRADLTARDGHGRSVVIEAQLGPADHGHLGQLVTYATALRADVAVWVVAADELPFLAEHLDALADLSQAYAGRREFIPVTVTLESAPSPAPLPPGEPLLARVRRAPDWPPGPPGGAPAALDAHQTTSRTRPYLYTAAGAAQGFAGDSGGVARSAPALPSALGSPGIGRQATRHPVAVRQAQR
jgi:hypothetical protein